MNNIKERLKKLEIACGVKKKRIPIIVMEYYGKGKTAEEQIEELKRTYGDDYDLDITIIKHEKPREPLRKRNYG